MRFLFAPGQEISCGFSLNFYRNTGKFEANFIWFSASSLNFVVSYAIFLAKTHLFLENQLACLQQASLLIQLTSRQRGRVVWGAVFRATRSGWTRVLVMLWSRWIRCLSLPGETQTSCKLKGTRLQATAETLELETSRVRTHRPTYISSKHPRSFLLWREDKDARKQASFNEFQLTFSIHTSFFKSLNVTMLISCLMYRHLHSNGEKRKGSFRQKNSFCILLSGQVCPAMCYRQINLVTSTLLPNCGHYRHKRNGRFFVCTSLVNF